MRRSQKVVPISIAFGKPFIANPDRVVRPSSMRLLRPLNRDTLTAGGNRATPTILIVRAVAPHAGYRDAERAWGYNNHATSTARQ